MCVHPRHWAGPEHRCKNMMPLKWGIGGKSGTIVLSPISVLFRLLIRMLGEQHALIFTLSIKRRVVTVLPCSVSYEDKGNDEV